MRVAQIVAGLDREDGGPSHTLPVLWERLSSHLQIEAFTTGQVYKHEIKNPSFELSFYPRTFPQRLKYSKELKEGLESKMNETDLCHNHGCWLYPNWVAGSLAEKYGKPLLISPLGHLDEWSLQYHSFRKKLFWLLGEFRNQRRAAGWIAKSKMEADQIKKLGMKGKIFIVPNGIDIKGSEGIWRTENLSGVLGDIGQKRILLFMSRIHPKKGVSKLLSVWDELQVGFNDWVLVIGGDVQNSYSVGLQKKYHSQIQQKRTLFLDASNPDFKKAIFSRAEIFILPSHSENFGQVVLEALSFGLPVITTRGCPWEGLLEHRCGWWIHLSEKDMADHLRHVFMENRDVHQEMGARGRQWVERDFALDSVVLKTIEVYREIID